MGKMSGTLWGKIAGDSKTQGERESERERTSRGVSGMDQEARHTNRFVLLSVFFSKNQPEDEQQILVLRHFICKRQNTHSHTHARMHTGDMSHSPQPKRACRVPLCMHLSACVRGFLWLTAWASTSTASGQVSSACTEESHHRRPW